MPQPYQIFTIYAREDAQYLKELRGQLRPLENAGRIKVWSDREINPGVEWEKEIVQHLDTADIILILVSADYYDSAYIHEVEIKYALARHEKGEAKVLPIIVRPVDFSDDPIISRLQVLPTDSKPVTDRHWQNRDDAWLDVVAGVKRTLGIIREAELQREQAALAAERQRREEAKQQREVAEHARQADLMARERQAREQREAEQRSREEQARYEREAAESAENERLARLRHEQEQEHRRTESSAWQQAATAHHLPAYENYLARYPQGEYAREARFRIKELRRKAAKPVAWGRYMAIGGGLLALLLAVWWVPKIFTERELQPAENQSVQQDSVQLSESLKLSERSPDNFKKDSAVSSSPEKIEKLTQSEAVSAEKTPPSTAPTSPGVTFNYPMVRVAGGTFQMGSPASEASRDAECQHAVTVGLFSMGKYEVTQAQWKAIMGNNPSHFKNCDDCPVEQVSWNDAQAFIKKLKDKTGKSYRLPTEAEWEYAARGGAGASSMTKTYAGSVAWYYDNAGSKTHPVGGKSPNEPGLYDMSGNVWEWCQDSWKPYPCDSKSTADSRFRVLRGGSWNSGASLCRTARRSSREPSDRRTYIGFRLVSVSLQ